MNGTETAGVLLMVRSMWPHSNLGSDPRAVLRVWHDELGKYPRESVEAVIRGFAHQGKEHAPLVGQVVHALEVDRVAGPDFGIVKQAMHRALKARSYRGRDGKPIVFASEREMNGVPPVSWWEEQFPGQGEKLRAWVEVHWQEFRMSKDGDTTYNAQLRDSYRAFQARESRSIIDRTSGRAEIEAMLPRLDPDRGDGLVPLRLPENFGPED